MDNKGQKMGAKKNQLQSTIFLLHEITLNSAHPPHQLFLSKRTALKLRTNFPGTTYKHPQILGSLYVCTNLLKFQEACTYPYKLLKTSVILAA